MRKKIVAIFLALFFCNMAFAETYYFKECQLSTKVYGDYFIDLDKNVIYVSLKLEDGTTQGFADKIKLVTDDRVISEITRTNEEFSTQYYLDARNKSIVRQLYKREAGIDLVRPEGQKSRSPCAKVKADWQNVKQKVEVKKEPEQTLQVDSSSKNCQGKDPDKWKNCQGEIIAKDGTKYIGYFKNGKIIDGTAIYVDGSKYIGEWKNGKSHGYGIKTWNDGKKYVGEFINNKQQGKGTFTYPDGSKYVGEFYDSQRDGNGTLTYADGRIYIGTFVKGNEYGEGTCFDKEGSTVECVIFKLKNQKTLKENQHVISLGGKKWIKVKKQSREEKKLKAKFDKKAKKICSYKGNFNILEKKIEVLEEAEKKSYTLLTSRPVVRIRISGIVECI